MSYRWIEHTAELELEIDAVTEKAIFAQAVQALAELLAVEVAGERLELVSLEVFVPGSERTLLLADWLDELVFRSETEGLVPQEVQRIELDESGLTATIRAARANPRPLVKGVTHHRLELRRARGGFQATVVLDV